MADKQQLKAEFQAACAAVGGEATESNFVNWLIAKAGTGPGGEDAEAALARKEGSNKPKRKPRGVSEMSLDKDFKTQFLLRVQDGRIEPLLNVREQAVEVAALKEKLVEDGHQLTAVSNKLRAHISTLRIFWRVGVYHHKGTEEAAGGQKLQLWGWASGRNAHPYVKAHPEVVDLRLKTSGPDKYPTHAEKEAALKAVPGLSLHELPSTKAECLEGEARQAMGVSPLC